MDRRSLNEKFIQLVFFLLLSILSNCAFFENVAKDRTELSKLNFTLPNASKLDPRFWSQGKSVIYFGFSHCPDMCPMALTNFGRTSLILGPLAKNYRFIFITLDPERDTPSLLMNYVNQFPSKNLYALSPANESRVKLEKLFNITRKKVEVGTSYTIDHSNFIYVLDEKLNQIAAFPGGTSALELSKQLRDMATTN